jgi:hypothetical protein
MGTLTSLYPTPSSNTILEIVEGVADGRTVSVNGTGYTFTNVTSTTVLTTSFQEVPGCTISYVPPTDAKYVSYKAYIKQFTNGQGGIMGYHLTVDGTKVGYSNRHLSGNYSNGGNAHTQFQLVAMYVFDLTTGSTDIDKGRINGWTTAKEIKVMARELDGTYQSSLNLNNWEDGTGASGTEAYDQPVVQIIAYG